jgi:hypothetical protein
MQQNIGIEMRANEFVTERKKQKRKRSNKYFGGYWYPGYGYYGGGYYGSGDGDSGDGGGGESIQEKIDAAIVKHNFYAEKVIELPELGKLKLVAYSLKKDNPPQFRIDVTNEQGEKIGYFRFIVMGYEPEPRFKLFAKKTNPYIIGGNVSVWSEYQRKGIARAVYDWIRSMGNDIKPSTTQTDAGRAMWRSFERQPVGVAQFLGEYPSIQTFMGEDKFGLVNYPSKEQQKIHRQYDITRNKEYAKYRPGSDLAYIGDYTSGDSYSLNDYLHRHYRKQAQKDDERIYKKQVQSLDRALTLQQLKNPLTVYTAVPESPANAWAVYGADVRRPIRLHLPAYTSTTTSLKVAVQFADENLPTDSVDHRKHPPRTGKKAAEDGASQIIMLTIPAGTPAASIKNISDIPEENEVLLPRGMNIEVNPRPTMLKNGDYVWHAQVIGHNPIQIVFPESVSENFADGKIKGKSRPGRVKRAGASCAGSVSELRSRAKKYGGEKGKMYHWCANMKGGRKNESADYLTELNVGNYRMGNTIFKITQHAIDRLQERKVPFPTVNELLRRVSTIRNQIEQLGVGQKLWAYDPSLEISLGLRLLDSGRINVGTAILGSPKHQDSSVPIITLE